MSPLAQRNMRSLIMLHRKWKWANNSILAISEVVSEGWRLIRKKWDSHAIACINKNMSDQQTIREVGSVRSFDG